MTEFPVKDVAAFFGRYPDQIYDLLKDHPEFGSFKQTFVGETGVLFLAEKYKTMEKLLSNKDRSSSNPFELIPNRKNISSSYWEAIPVSSPYNTRAHDTRKEEVWYNLCLELPNIILSQIGFELACDEDKIGIYSIKKRKGKDETH